MKRMVSALRAMSLVVLFTSVAPLSLSAQRTEKPVLHGKHWVAITGKPMSATAGAENPRGRSH